MIFVIFIKIFRPKWFQLSQFSVIKGRRFFVEKILTVFKDILNFVPNIVLTESSDDHDFFPIFSSEIFENFFPLLKFVV